LCQSCAKLVDSDEGLYTVELLKAWKVQAEFVASRRLNVQQSLKEQTLITPTNEYNLTKDKLFQLRGTIFEPINKLNENLISLTIFAEEGRLNEIDFKNIIDMNAQRIGIIAIEYKKYSYLFSQEENYDLKNLINNYESHALQNEVINCFVDAGNFHKKLLQFIDAKIHEKFLN
jgi:hypothetical protein